VLGVGEDGDLGFGPFLAPCPDTRLDGRPRVGGAEEAERRHPNPPQHGSRIEVHLLDPQRATFAVEQDRRHEQVTEPRLVQPRQEIGAQHGVLAPSPDPLLEPSTKIERACHHILAVSGLA
jgi:hypothetical protein